MAGPTFDDAVQGVIRACYAAGEDVASLHDHLLGRLNRVVAFDASFMATSDPDTLLFTRVFADDALVASAPQFLDNEFGTEPDVNRFVDLARGSDPVGSLDTATEGQRPKSARWREIMRPLGMGDELRVALRADGTAWGYLCLHRSGGRGFGPDELAVLRAVAPHAGAAIRRVTTALASSSPSGVPEATETVVLVADHLVVAVAGDGSGFEDDLTPGGRLPVPLDAVVHRLEAVERAGPDVEGLPPASVRVTMGDGGIVAVHAARLRDASGHGPVVLTLAPAAPAERSSLLLAGHGLTPAQCRVAMLVVQGRTTAQIVLELSISAHTVQDHLKAVFDKVGVRSRRELVTVMMQPVHR